MAEQPQPFDRNRIIIEAQAFRIQAADEEVRKLKDHLAIAKDVLEKAGIGEDFDAAFELWWTEIKAAKTQIARWQREYELERYQAEKWRRLYRKLQKEKAKPRSAAG